MVTGQRPRSSRFLVVTLVVVSLAVITLDYREGDSGPLAGLRRGRSTAMAPLQRGVTDVTRPVGNFFIGLAHLPSLQSENQDLKLANSALRARSSTTHTWRPRRSNSSRCSASNQSLSPPSVAALVIANGLSGFPVDDHGPNKGIR